MQKDSLDTISLSRWIRETPLMTPKGTQVNDVNPKGNFQIYCQSVSALLNMSLPLTVITILDCNQNNTGKLVKQSLLKVHTQTTNPNLPGSTGSVVKGRSDVKGGLERDVDQNPAEWEECAG